MQHVRNLTCGIGLSALISFLKEEKYRFVTPTPATHSRNNQRAGNERARSLTDAFGWSRPFSRSLLPNPLFDLLRDGAVVFECAAGWKSSVRASTLDGDLFLHSAFPTVSPDAVFFGPDTYRFASAIKNNLLSEPRQLRRALDLGCGSGAGGVILAKNASCRELVLTDINDTALQMTRLNAQAAGVRNVTTVHSDLFANVDGEFDMIVANPPYLNDPLQRAYRHGGGELGSGLSVRIAQAAKDRLSPGGTLLMYTGSPVVGGVDRLLQAVEEDFAGGDLRWSYEEIDPDVFGEELETAAYSTVDRIAAVVLTARKPGALAC
ncbi:MAG TPA: class I SAM-dependent methyltransferase [Bradyrhizobium sp.]|jgi:methylase of polypeptide subunit release factors|nr:class I SAM-dependent methyltransferase [Bradyrhizobium sp.]